jgi:ADP-heptose:LPS heptosyltransferase
MVKRILIIRVCAIGDFIVNLPALSALRNQYPNALFTLVGNVAGLELAREFVPVENVCSIELPPWSRLFYEAFPSLEFDFAVVWMKDPAAAENLRQSGIPSVIRADPFPVYGHGADHLLRTLKLQRPELPDLWSPQSDDVIIHPGSGSPKKIWPRFEELLQRLPNALTLVPPSPSRRGQGEGRNFGGPRPSPALRAASPSGRGMRLLEDLSLTEIAQLIRTCRAYIGNDSGLTHLAAYLGCPAIALFGPTDPRVFGPLGRRSRIIWKSKIEDITVDEVLQAVHGITRHQVILRRFSGKT